MSFFLSPLVTAIAAVVAAVIGALVVILVGRRSRRFQTIESGARADLSLDVELSARVIVAPNPGMGSHTVVLETRIEVKNSSRITGCIPSIYVSGRALIDSHLNNTYVGETDFEKLSEHPPLSGIVNVAQLQRSIFQLAPDEIERFVRWDTLDEEFVRNYPVVVMNVELFGASAEYLGEIRFPRYRKGKLRDNWIDFVGSECGARHQFILFDRWQGSSCGEESEFEVGSRYLRSVHNHAEPDVENTRRFRKVLDGLTQWSRHVTVDLLSPLQEMINEEGQKERQKEGAF